MSYEEVELIRGRSLRMLKHAKMCLTSGDYDLASFLAEQAAQLFLKSKILELTGEMPRTHVIRQLFHMLRELVNPSDKLSIDSFVRENRRLMIGLEEAYLSSRYFFKIYEKEEAEELVEFSEKVIDFVKSLKV